MCTCTAYGAERLFSLVLIFMSTCLGMAINPLEKNCNFYNNEKLYLVNTLHIDKKAKMGNTRETSRWATTQRTYLNLS